MSLQLREKVEFELLLCTVITSIFHVAEVTQSWCIEDKAEGRNLRSTIQSSSSWPFMAYTTMVGLRGVVLNQVQDGVQEIALGWGAGLAGNSMQVNERGC